MCQIKRLTATLILLGALCSLTATVSAAALPEFLPGNAGERFTGTGGAGTLEVGASEKIVCRESSVTSENIGMTKKEALALFSIKGCSFFGIVGMKSLGDVEGTVLVHAELKLCYINLAKKEVGLLSKILPVHLEVAGKLLVWEGDQVAKITPTNTKTAKYQLTYEESGGKPKPAGCEGEKEHLTVSVNEGSAIESGWATTDQLTYTSEQTLDA